MRTRSTRIRIPPHTAHTHMLTHIGENAFIMALSRGTNLSLCAFLLAHTTSAAAGTRQHATRNTPLMLVCANFALRDLAVAILDKGGAINAKNEVSHCQCCAHRNVQLKY